MGVTNKQVDSWWTHFDAFVNNLLLGNAIVDRLADDLEPMDEPSQVMCAAPSDEDEEDDTGDRFDGLGVRPKGEVVVLKIGEPVGN